MEVGDNTQRKHLRYWGISKTNDRRWINFACLTCWMESARQKLIALSYKTRRHIKKGIFSEFGKDTRDNEKKKKRIWNISIQFWSFYCLFFFLLLARDKQFKLQSEDSLMKVGGQIKAVLYYDMDLHITLKWAERSQRFFSPNQKNRH